MINLFVVVVIVEIWNEDRKTKMEIAPEYSLLVFNIKNLNWKEDFLFNFFRWAFWSFFVFALYVYLIALNVNCDFFFLWPLLFPLYVCVWIQVLLVISVSLCEMEYEKEAKDETKFIKRSNTNICQHEKWK